MELARRALRSALVTNPLLLDNRSAAKRLSSPAHALEHFLNTRKLLNMPDF